MMRVTSAEFIKSYGAVTDEALKGPITITRNGRDRLVLVSADEYRRLKLRDRRAALAEEMSGQNLALLERQEISEEYADFDDELKDWTPLHGRCPKRDWSSAIHISGPREAREGREEGTKDRSCAVILVVRGEADETRVVVLPITHAPPRDPAKAIEIPALTKKRLGLDSERSWVVVSEYNDFVWPGPDLRMVPGRGPESAAYGALPKAFIRFVIIKFGQAVRDRKARQISRTE